MKVLVHSANVKFIFPQVVSRFAYVFAGRGISQIVMIRKILGLGVLLETTKVDTKNK